MCLILFSYKNHSHYDLILASNRDEFRDRPTAQLDFWEDFPDVLAGRDLMNGGTWMGITRTGRFAALTNFRSLPMIKQNSPSRGDLVKDFLLGDMPASDYIQDVKSNANSYSGFNLIVGNMDALFYLSNCKKDFQQISSGLFGLSNNYLDVPWPKVTRGKQQLSKCLENNSELDIKQMFTLLSDTTCPETNQLPRTGVSLEWEKMLSPIFIDNPFYGTRSQSIIIIKTSGYVSFYERTIHRDNIRKGDIRKRSFQISC
jgi:uncharacterized protein with NRDE domain